MPDSATIIFATSTLVLLSMPGPTNALLAASGAARGFANSGALLLAQVSGYAVAIGLLLMLDSVAGNFRGEIGVALRLATAVILIAVAYRMWRLAGAVPDARDVAPSAGSVFLLTLANPKSLILAFALFPSMREIDALMTATALFGGIAASTGLGWIAAGAITRKLPGRPDVMVARLSALVIAGFACFFSASAAVDLIPIVLA